MAAPKPHLKEVLKRAIYTARENGMSYPDIATRFSVGIGTAYRICQRHDLYGPRICTTCKSDLIAKKKKKKAKAKKRSAA